MTAALALPAIAFSQTGPDVLLKPWRTGEWIQSQGDFRIQNEGSTKNSNDFRLTTYDLSGRMRLMPGEKADPRMGFNYTEFNTDGDPALPSHMIDTSANVGVGIADWNGWLAGITIGAGYAGSGAFDDGDAWYGMADFLVGHEFDKTSSIGFVLDYNGNRTLMPDVPLPGFLYTKQLEPQIVAGIGFPYSSIEWKPNDQMTLSAKYYLPDDLQLHIDYDVIETLSIFGDFRARQQAFHWDQITTNADRIIYISRQVEAGIRWSPVKCATLIVAGGYAFSQEFNVGFDTRDQDRIAKPSDEPYLRAGFEVRF